MIKNIIHKNKCFEIIQHMLNKMFSNKTRFIHLTIDLFYICNYFVYKNLLSSTRIFFEFENLKKSVILLIIFKIHKFKF